MLRKHISGYYVAFGAALFICMILFSDTFSEATRFFLFFVLFNYLPAIGLLDLIFPEWREKGFPFLVAFGFAPAAGIIAFFPLWLVGVPKAHYVVPILAIIYLLLRPNAAAGKSSLVSAVNLDKGQLLLLMVAIFGTPLLALTNSAAEPPNPHFLVQAALASKIGTGFRPENAFVAGVPLAYNYAVHVWMASSTYITSIPLEHVSAYLGPVTLLSCAAASLAAFTIYLSAPVWIASSIVICVFWYVGWPPFAAQLFGRAITWSTILVLGPLLAFSIFFVLLTALGQWLHDKTPRMLVKRFLAVLLLSLAAFGARATVGPITVCALLLYLMIAFFRRDTLLPTLVYLSATVLATALGFIIFLGYGTNFNPSGFTKINLTPFPYLAQFTFFWLPFRLQDMGVAPQLSGVIQFLALLVLQAGFLTPFLYFAFVSMRKHASPTEILLLGSGLAGIGAIFFTESLGGSHFTFFHYTTLAFTVLGGLGLNNIAGRRDRTIYLLGSLSAALIVFQIYEIPSQTAARLAARIASPFRSTAPIVRACPDDEPLEKADIPPGATVILPLGAGGYCQRLRFLITHPNAKLVLEETLREYAKWNSPLQTMLQSKVHLLDQGADQLARSYDGPSYVLSKESGKLQVKQVVDEPSATSK